MFKTDQRESHKVAIRLAWNSSPIFLNLHTIALPLRKKHVGSCFLRVTLLANKKWEKRTESFWLQISLNRAELGPKSQCWSLTYYIQCSANFCFSIYIITPLVTVNITYLVLSTLHITLPVCIIDFIYIILIFCVRCIVYSHYSVILHSF